MYRQMVETFDSPNPLILAECTHLRSHSVIQSLIVDLRLILGVFGVFGKEMLPEGRCRPSLLVTACKAT